MLIDLPDPAATAALGAALAPLLRQGDAVLLEGPLGAGKTALARALIRAAAGAPALAVPSPSFSLVQSYDTPVPIHHFDLWRLSGPEPLAELGWDEARATGAVLVEWPDRLGALQPPDALTITLAPAGEGRRATLAGWPGRIAGLTLAP